MRRIYALGIVMMLIALNIPEVTGDIRNRITFYTPVVTSRLSSARNVAEPAIISIIGDLQRSAKIKINGKGNNNIDTTDLWTLTHGPSITSDQFDSILRDYNSPAAGSGYPVSTYAKEKQIDSAYVLYIFIHESTAGTNPNWNADTKNIGNIICAGYSSCIGRFRSYTTWEDGFKASIDLLAYYRDELKIETIDKALEKWAPPDENDTQAYIDGLHENVSKWRSVNEGQYIALGEKGGLETWKPVFAGSKSAESIALPLTGCLGTNVNAAYVSSPGLQEFKIASGKNWSFNEQWKIDYGSGVMCGVYYGGICDMAGRYSQVAHKLGLETDYTYHGFNLTGLAKEDSTSIWSDGSRGGQDLVIRNITDKTAYFHAYMNGGDFIVTGYLE